MLASLGLGAFITSLLTIGPTPFFPRIAADLGVSVPLLGQVTSVMLLLSAPFGLITGPLADRSGNRPVILVGLTAAVACLFCIALAPTYPLLFLASLAGAVTTAAVLGPSFAMASTLFTGATARRAVGWTNGAQSVSAIVGIPALTAIGAMAGWRMAFVVAGIAAAAVLTIAAVALPRDRRHTIEPLRLRAVLAPYRPVLGSTTMQRLYIASLCAAVCWFGFVTYLGAMLTLVLGLALDKVGLVYMISGSCYFAGSLAVGGPLARYPAARLVIAGFGVMAVCLLVGLTARFGVAASVAVFAIAALAMGVGVVSMIARLSRETPGGLGTTLTLNTVLYKVGSAAGAALGGLLLASGGFPALAMGLPLFGVAAVLLTLRAGSPAGHGVRDGHTA